MVAPAQLPDDWSYLLAEAFLDAAVSCGATCERRYVSFGNVAEGPAPGCPCQLVALVTEGIEPLPNVKCGVRRTATVRLVLDLCGPAAGEDEVPDPVKWQTAAREQAAVRWKMMQGLNRARQRGELCGAAMPDDGWPAGTQVACCGNITPGPWRPATTGWGNTRWETSWTWHE